MSELLLSKVIIYIDVSSLSTDRMVSGISDNFSMVSCYVSINEMFLSFEIYFALITL